MTLFEAGERVGTARYGAGVVVKDERLAENPYHQPARDRVWVLLDAGANPQVFQAGELRRTRQPDLMAALEESLR